VLAFETLAALRCPDCGAQPLHSETAGSDGEVRLLVCPVRHSFAVKDAIPNLTPHWLPTLVGHERWLTIMERFLIWRSERRQRLCGGGGKPAGSSAAAELESTRIIQGEMLDFAQPSGLTLDVGCGAALPLRLGRIASDVYVGIDPIVIESVRYDFQFVQGVSDALPFADSLFGTVLFNGSFEMVLDPERTIREAVRVLKPGGRIAINTASGCHDRDAPVDELRMRNVFLEDVVTLLSQARCRFIETNELNETMIFVRARGPRVPPH
jgi:SAM-dependent methyltransferase